MRRQFAAVTLLTAVAQGAGLIKLWLTARLFGVGAELDGYFLALLAPTFLSGALSGMLQTALFPVRARLAAEEAKDVLLRFERTVLAGLLVLGAALGLILWLAGPWILAWSGTDLAPAVRESARFVFPFAALLIPLNTVGDGLGYLLAMRNRYPVAAAAPIANALLGAGLLYAWPEGGLLNLALGTVAGLALQVCICLLALQRQEPRLLAAWPAFAGLQGPWRKMSHLSVWILPGVIFSNLSATLPTVMIAPYGEGAVSAFGYAWRLHTYAIQLLVMATSPVLLARFSDLIAVGDEKTLRRLLRQAVAISSAIGLGSVVLVAWAGVPLLELLFGGRFDSQAAEAVAGHWLWLCVALGPALLGNVYVKVWQARRLAQAISLLAALGLVSFWVLHAGLSGWLGSQAVAAAVGLASFVVPLAGWRLAWRGPSAVSVGNIAWPVRRRQTRP